MSALGQNSLKSFSQIILTISKNEGKRQCFAWVLKMINSTFLRSKKEKPLCIYWRKSMKLGPTVKKCHFPLPGKFYLFWISYKLCKSSFTCAQQIWSQINNFVLWRLQQAQSKPRLQKHEYEMAASSTGIGNKGSEEMWREQRVSRRWLYEVFDG